MASSYTSSLGIEKPGSGEQAGTWGTTTNTNFDIIDRAIAGVGSISLGGSTKTLTTNDGALSEGGYRVLSLTGTPGSACTITIDPNDQPKFYLVKNGSDQNAVFQQGDGDGGGSSGSNDGQITLIPGELAFIFSDGNGSNSIVTKVNVGVKLGDNLDVNGKSIVTTSNGNIVLAPNGTGDVQVDADTLRVGDADADATITTNGTGDLTLSTNSGTNSGTIVIADGANGDITIAPNGTGKLTITGSNIVFEGATADDHETTFAVTDPTADRTITFPDSSGTVALSADISSAVPVGTVLVTAQTSGTEPTGYKFCNGQDLNTYTFAALHAVISNTYGGTAYNAGVTDQSGVSTTFKVPDTRGRVIAGQDNMGSTTSQDNLTGLSGGINGDTLGATGGSETHTLTTAQLASHSHTLNGGLLTVSSGGNSAATGIRPVSLTSGDEGSGTVTVGNTNFDNFSIASNGSGSAHNNVQPTIILNYMIKT